MTTSSSAVWLVPDIANHAVPGARDFSFPLAYRILKRFLDVTVAALGLTVLAPLLAVISFCICLDSRGSALFVQPRVGQGGRVFKMLKFRTMITGSAVRLGDEPHKQAHDPRVTRVGRLLRKTSLDELPQLVNVLLGHMSLVGPRPELVEIVKARYEPWQYARLLVPQGMTGWWQVTGRGTKLLFENTEDDLYYIERASFWFDIRILAMTVRAVIRRDGAF
jgi:lipopolysaccharide/colanic/teichoic acid biosynthesis glycosyltransferase